jgi:hypothetical protein
VFKVSASDIEYEITNGIELMLVQVDFDECVDLFLHPGHVRMQEEHRPGF